MLCEVRVTGRTSARIRIRSPLRGARGEIHVAKEDMIALRLLKAEASPTFFGAMTT